MSATRYEWLTTDPAPGAGMNAAGGWRLHAIKDAKESDSFDEVRHLSAVCGLRSAACPWMGCGLGNHR